MRLELTGSEEHAHAFFAELIDGSPEGASAGERGVHEGQDDDWDREADSLGEDAEGVGVADAERAFADRVVGGWGDDHRVGVLRSGLAGRPVAVAHGRTGQCFQGGDIEEVERGGRGDELDRPAALLGELDQRADIGAGPAPQTMTDRTRPG